MFLVFTGKDAQKGGLPTSVDADDADPRLTVDVQRTRDYYATQSEDLTRLIRILGVAIAAIMGVGAVFGALNTMYAAVSTRSREIATLRALGFSPPDMRGSSTCRSTSAGRILASMAG